MAKGVKIPIFGEFDERAFAKAAKRTAGLQRLAEQRNATAAGKWFATADKMALVGRKMQTVGASLTRNLTIPLGLAGIASAALAIDFGKSMSKITGLAGVPEKQMGRLTGQIRDAAEEFGVLPKAAAEAYYFIASSGLSGKRAVDMMNVSLKAQAAQLGEAKIVADYATSAIGAYGAAEMTGKRAVDALTAAVRVGKGEPEDYAANLGKVTASGAVLKVSLEELLGAVSALTLKGISVDEGTTAINQFFANIIKPSKEAIEALKGVGLTVDDVRDTLGKQGIIATLQMLDKAFKGNRFELAQIFGNVRSLKAVYQLLNGDMTKTKQVFAAVAESGGALDDAFKKVADQDWFKLEQGKAALADAGITIGSVLLPPLADLAVELTEVIKPLDSLPEGWKKAAVGAGVFLAVLGPGLSITGGALVGLSRLANLIGVITLRFNRASKAGAAFKAVSSGLGAAPGVAVGKSAGKAGGKFVPWGVPAAAPLGGAGTIAGAIVPVAVMTMAPLVIAAIAGKLAPKQLETNLMKKAIEAGGGRVTPGTGRYGLAAVPAPATPQWMGAFGGVGATAASALGVVQAKLQDLPQGSAAAASLLKTLGALQAVAAKPLKFGTIDAKKPLASMRSFRDRMQQELGLTRKQADTVMRLIFGKQYKVRDIKPPDTRRSRKAVQDLAEIYRKQGAAAAAKFAVGVAKMPGIASAKAALTAAAILAGFKGLGDKGYNIGVVFANSVARGISAATDSAALRAEQLARRVEMAARAQLKNGPPSLVGIDIGEVFASSIGQGIDEEASALEAASRLADRLAQRARVTIDERQATARQAARGSHASGGDNFTWTGDIYLERLPESDEEALAGARRMQWAMQRQQRAAAAMAAV